MRWLPLVVLVVLAGCHGGMSVIGNDTADTDLTDTDTDVQDTAVTADDVAETLIVEGAQAPIAWYVRVRGWVSSDSACPTVASVDAANSTVTGDCTDNQGVAWLGTANFRHLDAGDRIDFDGFGTADELLSGQILVTGDVLTANHVARDASSNVVYAHNAHTFTPESAAEAVAIRGESGTYDTSGQLTLGGIGVFTVTGQIIRDGSCDREPDQGDFDATGPQTYDYDINGGAICDGCVSWSGSTGSGEVCPWM